MPPRIRVTEDAILDAAIQIVRKEGFAGVNARKIGKVLGCSVQPIFRNYQTMEKLKEALYKKTETLFDERLMRGLTEHPIPFLGLGLAYIDFARKEKNLFKYLFMSDGFKGKSIPEIVRDVGYEEVIKTIQSMTGFGAEKAEQMFLSNWLFAHGIAAMIAANEIHFSEDLICNMLMNNFLGVQHQLSVEAEN